MLIHAILHINIRVPAHKLALCRDFAGRVLKLGRSMISASSRLARTEVAHTQHPRASPQPPRLVFVPNSVGRPLTKTN